MNYKIEPWVGKISSPITAVFPDGEKRSYCNGKAVVDDAFDKHYVVDGLSVVDGAIELRLVESESLGTYDTESFF